MKDFVAPRALRADEIPLIVDDYRRAAANAKTAGFDGVEVHSANNYLLEQFIRDSTNRRSGAYSGSLENRLKFPLQVVQAVIEVRGADRVGVRISPITTTPGETPLDIEGVTQMSREEAGGVHFSAPRRRFRDVYRANNQCSLALAESALANEMPI